MSAQRSRTVRRLIGYTATLAAVILFAVLFLPRLGRQRTPSGPLQMAFDGSSEELAHTVIVPTLDTPMPVGKNVVWCASFQLAWNEMRDEIVGEPIRIENAEEIAARLNAGKASKDDLEPADYYIKAGAVADGVIEQIQQDMAARFPDAPTPEIEASIQAVVAYAYLAANVKFTIPFFENNEEFLFDGVPVSSFGVRKKDEYAYDTLRKQVEILYAGWPQNDDRTFGMEFAVDPCKRSEPYRLILARVKPEGTLEATVASLEKKIKEWDGHEYERELGLTNVFLVPNIKWRIFHNFRDLEGTDKTILNRDCPIFDYWVREASQLIDFTLDRSGAELKSEAKHVCEAEGETDFIFHRPFLIVMKKRGAEEPFFVMWVDNAELLCKP